MKKEETKRNDHYETYDTDKYFITRISGGLMMLTVILAVIIILVW